MPGELFCETQSDKRVVVAGRLAWPRDLTTPSDGGSPGSGLKYRLNLLLPKGLDISPLRQLEANVAKTVHGAAWESAVAHRPFHKVATNKWLLPLADELLPEFLKANQSFVERYPDMKPKVLNGDRSPYTGDGSGIYSGRWVRAVIEAFAAIKPSKYVKFTPVIVQLLDDDTHLQLGAEQSMDGLAKREAAQSQKSADDVWAA